MNYGLNNILLVTTDIGTIYALNSKNGDILWSKILKNNPWIPADKFIIKNFFQINNYDGILIFQQYQWYCINHFKLITGIFEPLYCLRHTNIKKFISVPYRS